MYIAEIAPPAIRGTLVSINQLALVSGILVAYLVDYALAGAEAWRWMFALAAFPAAVLAIGMLFLPESPRWLIAHDHLDQGRRVLTRIRAGKTAETEREIADIRSGLALQSRGWDELRHPGVRPALLVGVLLALFQQLTGINTVIYYAPTIFQYAGITSSSAAILATVGVGVINVLTTIVAVRLIDRIGRRPLLLVSLVGMTVSLVALGLAFRSPSTGGAIGWFAAVSLAVYIASFAVGLGPVFWLLISEIYPLSVRGVGMSLATVVNWVTNLLVALTFLTLIDRLGKPGTFWLYASISVIAVVFSILFIPETKGKTLEEIEAHWHAGGRLQACKAPQGITLSVQSLVICRMLRPTGITSATTHLGRPFSFIHRHNPLALVIASRTAGPRASGCVSSERTRTSALEVAVHVPNSQKQHAPDQRIRDGKRTTAIDGRECVPNCRHDPRRDAHHWPRP